MSTPMAKPIPPSLETLRLRMDRPTTSPISCEEAAAVLDWYYWETWQTEEIEQVELEWLLGWMRHCDDPRRFEIADGLCVTLIGAGKLDQAAALAEELLAEHADPGLTHTLALARAASGAAPEAIALLSGLIGQPAFAELPAEVATQVLLDLATLYRRQGSLFKAIPLLTQAVETAARVDDPAHLEQAADLLIEQLIEQGGSDEAVEILSPWLDEHRLGLWRQMLTRLGPQLDTATRERGMALMIEVGDYRTVLSLLIDQSADDPQALLLAFTAALALKAPAEVVCPLAGRLLVSDVSRREKSAPLIAAAAVAVAETQEEKTTMQAKWHRDAVVQLISVAKHHGILEEEVRDWVENEGLYHEQGVIDRAARYCLNKIDHPPGWLFRRLGELRTNK